MLKDLLLEIDERIEKSKREAEAAYGSMNDQAGQDVNLAAEAMGQIKAAEDVIGALGWVRSRIAGAGPDAPMGPDAPRGADAPRGPDAPRGADAPSGADALARAAMDAADRAKSDVDRLRRELAPLLAMVRAVGGGSS